VIAAFCTSAEPLDVAALATHCAGRLARYKCPRIFRRIDRLPRSPTGKLLRRQLREVPE
jgi:acyl-CoA synthetase (AMP-forming)/AMP-acid ligase II